MASSQVELASFVSFGCVSRKDQNRRAPDHRYSSLSVNTSATAGETPKDFSCPNNTRLLSRDDRENSPTHSESSTEIPNHGGVSSLVRKWKGLSGEHHNGPPESLDIDRFDSQSTTPPAAESTVGGESERVVRVADVIRKLTTEGDDNELDHHRRLQMPEQRQFFAVPFVNSPRIRGRQALTDLLLQLERERRVELDGLLQRRPVSNFSHKGKIQALLRLRFLHREAVNRYQDHLNNSVPIRYNLHRGKEKVAPQPQSCLSEEAALPCEHHHQRDDSTISDRQGCNPAEQHRPHLASTTSEYKPIVTLRDSFKFGIESDVTNPKRARRDLVNKYVANFSTNSPHTIEVEEPTSLEVDDIEEQPSTSSSQDSIVYTPNEIHEHSSSFPDEKQQRTNEVNRYQLNCQDLSTCSSNEHVEKEDGWKEILDQIIVNTKNSSSDMCQSQSDFEEEDDGVNWQEVENEEQQGAKCDWTNEICRPISDWEDLRQARYDEMLNPFNSNQDIQYLLERRSVSNFLFSNLRQKIDQLMISRSNTLRHSVCDKLEEPLSQSRTEQHVTSQILGEMDVSENGQEGGLSADRIDYYKDPAITGSELGCSIRSCYEVNDSSDPHDESTCTISQSPILDKTHNSSSPSQSSMELDLIHDLRGHIIQLQQEMYKLRKSMKYCMEMQVNLQCSIKNEVAAAVKHEVASILGRSVEVDMGVASKKGRGSPNPKKGICSICNEMQVDSLLYRCGHMCTCFECAHQLQIESGICPVCGSLILDVVQVSVDNIHPN